MKCIKIYTVHSRLAINNLTKNTKSKHKNNENEFISMTYELASDIMEKAKQLKKKSLVPFRSRLQTTGTTSICTTKCMQI